MPPTSLVASPTSTGVKDSNVEQARQIGYAIGEHQTAVVELSQRRMELLESLLASGWTNGELAKELNLTPSRMSRLLSGRRPAAVQS